MQSTRKNVIVNLKELKNLNEFELRILDFIREHLACPFLDAVMPVITSLANGGII